MSLLFTICALHFVAQLSPGPDVLLIAKSAASTTRANTLKIIGDLCRDCGVGRFNLIGLYGSG